MQSIREITTVVSEEVTVRVPKEFYEKKIEIIILPIDDFRPDTLLHQDEDDFDREVETLSWEMGKRLYTTRDQLHER